MDEDHQKASVHSHIPPILKSTQFKNRRSKTGELCHAKMVVEMGSLVLALGGLHCDCEFPTAHWIEKVGVNKQELFPQGKPSILLPFLFAPPAHRLSIESMDRRQGRIVSGSCVSTSTKLVPPFYHYSTWFLRLWNATPESSHSSWSLSVASI